MPRRRTLLAVVALAGLGLAVLILQAGNELVYRDDLTETCEAAVVFGGGLPFRAMEAAAAYGEGAARNVWLTQGPISPEDVELLRMGIQRPAEHVYNAEILEKLGVPRTAQRVLEGRVQNTAEEVQHISKELEQYAGACVVLVTSKAHSRRVRITWDLLASENQKAFVRYATRDPFDAAHWWGSTDSILAVARETGGIVNALLGFPIATQREAEEAKDISGR